jgi:hypothetical protein
MIERIVVENVHIAIEGGGDTGEFIRRDVLGHLVQLARNGTTNAVITIDGITGSIGDTDPQVVRLLGEIRQQNLTILSRLDTMGEDLTGIQQDLATLKDDNATLATALTTIAQNIATLVANAAGGATAAQLSALKAAADQVVADANANTSAATTIATPAV